MNAIIIRHDLSEILTMWRQVCTALFRELKIIFVHKLPRIPPVNIIYWTIIILLSLR